MTPSIIRQGTSARRAGVMPSPLANPIQCALVPPLCLWAGDVVLTNEARFAVLLWAGREPGISVAWRGGDEKVSN